MKRLTIAKRMRSTLKEIDSELRRRRHKPIPEHGAWLGAAVRGYFVYDAVPTNGSRLSAFRSEVTRTWMLALRRRSQRDRMTGARMLKVLRRWLPAVRIQHPWPDERFDARTRGRSRVREQRLLGSVRGAAQVVMTKGRPYRDPRDGLPATSSGPQDRCRAHSRCRAPPFGSTKGTVRCSGFPPGWTWLPDRSTASDALRDATRSLCASYTTRFGVISEKSWPLASTALQRAASRPSTIIARPSFDAAAGTET